MSDTGYRQVVGNAMGGISSVVSSLPPGARLGDERVLNGILYRLVYNAGTAQIIPGNVASPVPLVSSTFSVTVSTLSDSRNHLGAVSCYHATAAASTYFWGVRAGSGVPLIPSATIAAGQMVMVGLNGKVTSAPSLPTEMVSNAICAQVLTSGTAATADGTFRVCFG